MVIFVLPFTILQDCKWVTHTGKLHLATSDNKTYYKDEKLIDQMG